ncbi:zinc finger MYM-type protein 1 [Trichonephila clavipes]|nr:zinc finger MYM-type protein 1 [Trichonephila clavipes]
MKDLDDQQPSGKDIVQRDDISNAPTEKCLENVGFEFEKYVDVVSWPISLKNHENSIEHKNSMLVWLTRKGNKSVLDKQLQEQIKKDIEYYYNVLKRVVAVVKYLAIRGLAFRGTEKVFGSPHNGNFMGAMELLQEFDPFIHEHIK